MSEIVEAPGTATEDALLARPVEAKAGEDDDGHNYESACLNCGTPLVGPHCHQCGQRGHVHRTLGAFFHDVLHGVLHFEGKTWRTLPLLAFRPGELTRRYIAGERARFVSPMALFLFSAFLMFAVFQIVGVGAPTDFETPQAASAEGNAAQLTASRGTKVYSGPEFVSEQFGNAKTGWPFVDHGIEKWKKNPGLMAYKLQANSYKFSWLLIPLSIPFMWLIFAWRRKFGTYDHAVFVTYSLGFMTLLFVALTVLGAIGIGGGLLVFAFTLIPLAHIYKQLRGAYSLPRCSAAWRTAALSFFILVILLLFVDLLLVLGALG